MTGTIHDISRSLDGKLRVTFEVDAVDEIRGMEGKELEIEVSAKKKKRSLNANAYFHVLVGKIADKLTLSKACVKNMMLGRYGQRWIEDEPVMLKVISTCDLYEHEDIHAIPVGYEGEYTIWALIRGSHEYNTREMSALINGTVNEAKELGIETMSPRELERMMKSWESQYSRQTKSAGSAEQHTD